MEVTAKQALSLHLQRVREVDEHEGLIVLAAVDVDACRRDLKTQICKFATWHFSDKRMSFLDAAHFETFLAEEPA